MTRPNGGWRCSYGAWHDLYETCKCWETNAAVMQAAFPPHPLVGVPMTPVACPDSCECRTWGRAPIVTDIYLPRSAA